MHIGKKMYLIIHGCLLILCIRRVLDREFVTVNSEIRYLPGSGFLLLGVAVIQHRQAARSATAERVTATVDGSHLRHSKHRCCQVGLYCNFRARSGHRRWWRVDSSDIAEWHHRRSAQWSGAVTVRIILLSPLHLLSSTICRLIFMLLYGHLVLDDLQYLNQIFNIVVICRLTNFLFIFFSQLHVFVVSSNYGTVGFNCGICWWYVHEISYQNFDAM